MQRDPTISTIRHKVFLALLAGWKEGFGPGERIPDSDIDDLRGDAQEFAHWFAPRYRAANGAGAMMLARGLRNGTILDEFYKARAATQGGVTPGVN